MDANKTLDMVTINRLRTDMARAHATQYRELVALCEQLRHQVNQKLYDHSPKTRRQR